MTRTVCTREDCKPSSSKSPIKTVEEYSNDKNQKIYYCHRCKHTNKQKSLITETKRKKWYPVPLGRLGILNIESAKFLNKFGLTLFSNCFWSEYYNRLVFPYKNFAWMRDVSDNPKVKWLYAGKPEDQTLYYLTTGYFDQNINCFDNQSAELVICEDVISAIRIFEYSDVIALCGTSLSKNKKEELKQLLPYYNNLIIWMDGDIAGRLAAQKLRNSLKLYIKDIKIIYTKKDPKSYDSNTIKQFLTGAV